MSLTKSTHAVKKLKLFKNDKESHSSSWELLSLVAHHLDPKTLAIASCVSKSWLDSFSSEDIWQPICSAEYPSAYSLKDIGPTVPYHRLYAIAYTAASKLQLRKPVKPDLSPNDLLFIINAKTKEPSTLFTLSKPCNEFEVDTNGIFKFAINIDFESSLKKEGIEGITVTWNIVLKGWRGIFNMMDYCNGKVSFVPEAEELFPRRFQENISDEDSKDDSKFIRKGKLSVAMMNTKDLRYLSMDDALRHLQHFLLPPVMLKK
ncbi:unnamed protein product [Dovyalis caffra]|uniref:F-box protein n=1 Tax=Dovyalis caffra TaxID=77055 RepID=A0AAV1RPM4_9ROSI|nr:unnamed protein product [Dovyalis caffra]